MLNYQQQQAVEHYLGPALILAVPGAGKTTVLIHRTANLINKYKIDPARILSITFSRASARDMEARFLRDYRELGGRVNFSTIHSLCFNIVRDYARQTRQVFSLIEDSRNRPNKYSLLREVYSSINKSGLSEDNMESLINALGYVKNMMIAPEDLSLKDIPNFSEIYRAYESIKKENKYIDFDDMLSLSLEILRSNRASLAHYQGLYDFIQLDEAQDTSRIQIEIIKLLALPGNNLFVVADDDQSIYGFRGAYPDGLLNFKDHYPQAKIFLMEENFRSSENIVTASKKLISNNMKRFKKNIFTSNDSYRPVKLVRLNRLEDQYDYICREILENPGRDYAVLYRNNISAIGLVNSLNKEGIDFFIKDRNLRFFKHWILEDIHNFLLFAEDTSNMEVYEKIYYKKKGYISRRQLDYARKLNPDQCVFQRIKGFPDIKFFYVKTLNELKDDFDLIKKLPVAEALAYIKYDLGYLDYLKEFSDKFGYSFAKLSLVLKLLEIIAQGLASREDFLARLQELRQACLNSSPSNLTLTTIHSAKGLEFDNVFLIDLVDGDFPSSTSIEKADEDDFNFLEEERRLFYVAMTRAKHQLTMFTVEIIDSSSVEQSRFIDDII